MHILKLTKKLIDKLKININKYGRNNTEMGEDIIINEENVRNYYNFYFTISYINKKRGDECILGGLTEIDENDNREISHCFIEIYNIKLIKHFEQIIGDISDNWRYDLETAEYELDFIFNCINDIRLAYKKKENKSVIKNIKNFIEDLFKNEYKKMDLMIKKNKIDFSSLWYYFDKPGKIYKTKTFKEWMCYKHGHFSYIENKQLRLTGKIITVLDGNLEYKNYTYDINYYKGFKNLNEFNIFNITEECKKEILSNSNEILKIYKEIKHMDIDGNQYIPSKNSFISKKRNERVIVDSVECGKNINNPWGDNKSEWNIDMYGNEVKLIEEELSEEDKLIIAPFLGIYNLGIFKTWGFTHIKYLKIIEYNEKAFDYLVLEENKKDIIMCLIKNYKNNYKDFIINKGEGIVFLLHGNPGVGKTLTAEAACEYLKKPLFIMNVADLGLTPDVVEMRLEDSLKLCERWEAILLLDEADVVLESRNISDINRNSLVCIFLKYLEYHKGIIFLTTNRLDSLDIAVKSRINLSLHYKNLTSNRRLAIWKSLFDLWKIKLKDQTLKKLSNYDFNGREIRNNMKIVFSLLKSRKLEVNGKNIIQCLEECYKLSSEFSNRVKTTGLYM
jgi:hypothetical protein